jgi:WD40 repeat protein
MIMMTSLILTAVALCGATETLEAVGTIRHPSSIRGVVCSDEQAYVARDDGWLVPYSLKTRAPQEGVRFPGELHAVALEGSGKRLAVAYSHTRIALVDAKTLEIEASVEVDGGPDKIAFSKDGLLVTLLDGHLIKLSVPELAETKRILPTKGSRILSLAVAPAGETVAIADREGNIQTLGAADLRNGKSWSAFDQYATALAYDATGKFLAAGDEEGELKIWNAETQKLLKADKTFHHQSIQCISFLPDGGLVTGGYDGLCQFWKTAKFQDGPSYPNYRGFITSTAVSAEGRWLVRAGSFLDVVSVENPDEFHRIAEYGGAITAIAVDRPNRQIVTGGMDQRLILWRFEGPIHSQGVRTDESICGVAFCAGGKSIAVGLADGTLARYATENLASEKSWKAHTARVSAIASEGDVVASVAEDGSIVVSDLDGKQQHKFQAPTACRSVALRGDCLAVGTVGGKTYLYDLTRGKETHALRGRPLSVTALAISADGQHMAVGYVDGALEVSSAKNGKLEEHVAGEGSSILCLQAGQGDQLAVGQRDGAIKIYRFGALDKGAHLTQQQPHEVNGLGWLANDRGLAAAGASNSIALLKIKSTK